MDTQKCDQILTSLASCVKHYSITDIALSIPDEHHQTDDFKVLKTAIANFACRHGFAITQYTAKGLYQRFGSPVKRTRKAFIKRMVLLYPELDIYYQRERTNKNKYYVKLFEAIAVAAVHSQKKV